MISLVYWSRTCWEICKQSRSVRLALVSSDFCLDLMSEQRVQEYLGDMEWFFFVGKIEERLKIFSLSISILKLSEYNLFMMRFETYNYILARTIQLIKSQTTMIGQDARFKKINNLLPATHKIRNVSIVAHVDHGKTTLADCLIASNGIIHKKQAGQLKLLDDRLDEQNRGITMKSSSICLLSNDSLINLIDSPGHLQFYCEVSAALRLTDCALLVVDVVEGVSSQTFRVLNQLYHQKLPSILILNKLDKLITQCKMDPFEAYNHLNQIIQQVNAILGTFIIKEIGNSKLRKKSNSEGQEQEKIQKLEDQFYFAPEKKNIIFGSALDNWGFSAQNFAPLLAKKFQTQPEKILKYLWGDFYYHPKKKEISEKPRNQNDKPLCVNFVLKPIWDIFEAVENQDNENIEKITKKLNLKVSENAKKKYGYHLTKEILNAWLPLEKIVLSRIVEILPNPIEAQRFRLPYLLQLNAHNTIIDKEISMALSECSHSQEKPLIIFISKMVNIPKANFNERGLQQLEGEGDSRTLAFGRIFSGRCRRGKQAILIGVKKKKIENEEGQLIEVPDLTKIVLQNLYVFNAQYPEGVEEAYAGNIVGIGGLQNYIFKSGTISTRQNCISFTPVASQTKSILKVCVSTPNIEDNPKMLQGLKKINRTDPSVDVYLEPSGDIILNTCGQVHLEKCLVDLESIFCKVPVKASDPIINYKETIVWSHPTEKKNEKFIEQAKKKKNEEIKKLMKEKYKEMLMIDAELDEQEKEKLKAIKEWDSHVEIYDSQDLTAEDTRFFFKNRQDEEEEKYNYKQEKVMKKVDHKNRGKLHAKKQFVNLNLKTNVNSQLTPNQIIQITIRAIGFDFQMAEYLEKNSDRMKKLFSTQNKKKQIENYEAEVEEFIGDLKEKMNQLNIDETIRNMIFENIASFGSNGHGPNILIIKNLNKKLNLFTRSLSSEKFESEKKCFSLSEKMDKLLNDYKMSQYELFNSILTGFSIACSAGPLCNEPLMGVIFVLEEIERVEKKEQIEFLKEEKEDIVEMYEKSEKRQEKIEKKQEKVEKQEKKQDQEEQMKQKSENQNNSQSDKVITDSFGPLAGQIMSTMKDACLQAFLGASPRLVEPMYFCELQTDQQYYGQIYNQLSKRRSKIIEEDLHEISNIFIIKAHLPITESFKFCSQILDKTQGTVNAQLNFDTWKIYGQDPFYVPFTQQEIEDDGIENLGHNSARILLDKIRQKKGLKTTEKIVVAAEKQRNRKKN